VRQKGLSYLGLAKIHYDSLKDYELAKSYYDSTVSTLPKDEENYAAIKMRQEILDEFVKHLLVIRTNDSLLALSNLSSDQLAAWALKIVTKDSLNAAEAQVKKEKLAKTQERQVVMEKNDGALISSGGDVTWYFASPISVSRGYTAFMRKWKNRPLEDNWRRSVKLAATLAPVVEDRPANDKQVSKDIEPSEGASISQKIQTLVAAVPTTEEQRTKLHTEVTDAMYALGNIYNFKLEEKGNAIETYEELLVRYPKCMYEPEVLYMLYLLNQESNSPKSQHAARRLLAEHAETVYAKLINNPNYREETFAATVQLQLAYKRAYALFKANAYELSVAVLDSAVRLHPVNEFSDNVQLLRILNIGYLEGQHKYQFELDNFVKSYSESELIPYVMGLIKSSDEYKANLFSASKAKYISHFEGKHYLLFIYPPSEANFAAATALFDGFLKTQDNSLKSGNLLLSDEHSMTVVNNIQDKEAAAKLFSAFSALLSNAEAFKGIRYNTFILTEENFDILYKTKDIESYKTFFEKNY